MNITNKILLTALLFTGMSTHLLAFEDSTRKEMPAVQADAGNAGLTIPAGFKALKVADNIGSARHIAVTPAGDIYVKLASPKNGKGILWLHDDNKDGKTETVNGFGDYGGTGLTIKNGYLYASSDDDVFRYKLDADDKVIDGSKT